MNKICKIGWWGAAVTTVFSGTLHFTNIISAKLTLPFLFPWLVLLLIGYTYKRNK